MADIIIDGGNAFSTYETPSGLPAPDLTAAIFSPTATTATARTPYITAAQFTEAGTGVDVSQLVPGADAAANAAALSRVIGRASAWADNLCRKTLAPTIDVQAGRYLVRDGIIRIPVRLAPIIALDWLSLGVTPYAVTPVALTADTAAIQPPNLVHVQAPGGCWGGTGRGFYQMSYVNGYGACTTLAGSAAAGGVQLNLATTLGVAPGMVLTVDDGGASEEVTVSPSYVPGAPGPVPLAAAVQYAHAAGVACSAMPPDIQQAVILLTAAMIKTRGNEAFVMQSLGQEPSTAAVTQAGGSKDLADAAALLAPYRRVW